MAQVEERIDDVHNWDECINIGISIVEYGTEAQWLLGRLACRIGVLDFHDPNLASKAKTLKVFAGEIRQSYEIVKDAARVVTNVPEDMRIEFAPLSFGHWREITRRSKARDGKTLRAWAKRATDMEWTVTRLREELRGVTDRDRKGADVIKVMRRVIGSCDDLMVFDFSAVWLQEPDEVMDLMKALAETTTTIEGARPTV